MIIPLFCKSQKSSVKTLNSCQNSSNSFPPFYDLFFVQPFAPLYLKCTAREIWPVCTIRDLYTVLKKVWNDCKFCKDIFCCSERRGVKPVVHKLISWHTPYNFTHFTLSRFQKLHTWSMVVHPVLFVWAMSVALNTAGLMMLHCIAFPDAKKPIVCQNDF